MLDERLGIVQWALFVGGAFVSFGGMVLLGVSGMTRRVYTYPQSMQWDMLNLITSVAGWAIGLSFLLLLLNILWSARVPVQAATNPWAASGLEWLTPSPPPIYNFPLIPHVSSRTPLWDDPRGSEVVTGLRVDQREVLVTTTAEADPDMRDPVPDPSLWPLVAAVVTTILLIASIFTPQAIVWGALPFAAVLVAWLYPRKVLAATPAEIDAAKEAPP
jgi:cytochrome c oxidase subunit I+III